MGYKIKIARIEAGMTQVELSQKSGISRTVISELETGKKKVTTTTTLLKIAKALNKNVEDIFFGDSVHHGKRE